MSILAAGAHESLIPKRPRSGASGPSWQAGHGTAKPAIVPIDNYDSFTYNLAHLLLTSGCHVEVIRNDQVAADQVAAFAPAGIVISPDQAPLLTRASDRCRAQVRRHHSAAGASA